MAMTLQDILANPKKLSRQKLILEINEFLLDEKNDMSEKVRAYKQLSILMGVDDTMGAPTKQKVEDYIRSIKPDYRYTPRPGSLQAEELIKWYDTPGRYSGD